jgi:hypothetical protein
MDEQVEVIYMIALECLANLVAPKQDEENLTKTAAWPCGYYHPLLTPPEIDLGEKKAESDLTDLEIVEQDVIKCLFRMNLSKRIVYLLDRMKELPVLTSMSPIRHAFDILIRMARHSLNCARQVSRSSRKIN